MAVRPKIRLTFIKNKKYIETSALVNSGFEATTPDIIIPNRLARKLGLTEELSKKHI